MKSMEELERLRPRMMSIAYRMLGSVVDAEDAVQDAFLRLQGADGVESPEGFLIRTTTRRCIDLLRRAKRRQDYVGPWLPEPIDTSSLELSPERADSLSQGFLLMLERLSATERAVFLLREVFEHDHAEIAAMLDKSVVHVRQILSRARAHLRADKVRFQSRDRDAHELAERFMAACRAGDSDLLEQLMTEDVAAYSDGGGHVTAARKVIRGPARVASFLAKVVSRNRDRLEMDFALVNGSPGVVFRGDGRVVQVGAFEISDRVRALHVVLNPEKLRRFSEVRIS